MSLESFKSGFVKRCQESGVDPALALDVALSEKQAGAVWDAVKGPMGTVAGAVKQLGPIAYFGIPIGAGAGAGYAASRMQELDEDDVEDVRKREMIDNYRQLAKEMEIRRKNRPQIPTRSRYPIVR